MKALVTAEVIKKELEKIKNVDFLYDGYNIDHIVMDRNLLKERIKDIDILICEYDTIDKEILEEAKKLKLIICCRGGYKSVIDTDETDKRNIVVYSTPGRNANAVADLIIGYILDMTRNISLTNNLIHNKVITMDFSTKPAEYKDTVWGLSNDSPFIMYRGKSINYMTLGIVGYGRVGKCLRKKAEAFGMNVIFYDPYFDNMSDKSARSVDFDTLIKESDIISINCPKTPSTENMFNKDVLNKMNRGSYLINTSRGGVVNEDDLVDSLNSGHLAGAALDVTMVEPISSKSRLLEADNLILTPHIGGSSQDVQIEGTKMVVEILKNWLNK